MGAGIGLSAADGGAKTPASYYAREEVREKGKRDRRALSPRCGAPEVAVGVEETAERWIGSGSELDKL